MVLALKCKLKDANRMREFLLDKGIYDKRYQLKTDKDFAYIPITKKIIKKNCAVVQKRLDKIDRATKLSDLLKNKLKKKEVEMLPGAYDVVGEIAILDLKSELKAKEKLIAQALLKLHKNIKTVVKKSGIHSGEFRLQKHTHLAGRRSKKTTHKENRVMLKLDIDKVYFSVRSGTERARIASKVKKGEKILVMFSGCAPFPLVIAKNSKPDIVVGIEKNKEGHKLALENLKLNKKIKNVELILGDVRKIVPKLDEKFDRICMPLPKNAEDFLDCALSAGKKGTIIHFYDFLEEKDIPKKAISKIKKHVKKFKVLDVVKCGQFSPKTFRICVDFKLL
ncbi:class I SAM-dependent methyltransferase family protein [Candidatus Woesearchaeota archaeon]|nr:class I SAM-dependent methyltransferase family protein [Candidatus Woesearchaeota archaeon]